jgi:hypothetical protein
MMSLAKRGFFMPFKIGENLYFFKKVFIGQGLPCKNLFVILYNPN